MHAHTHMQTQAFTVFTIMFGNRLQQGKLHMTFCFTEPLRQHSSAWKAGTSQSEEVKKKKVLSTRIDLT